MARRAKNALEIIGVKLLQTRLVKLEVNMLLPPEESKNGILRLAYKSSFNESIPEKEGEGEVSIEGGGFDGSEPARPAFTVASKMQGIFALSRVPTEQEVTYVHGLMADLLVPLLCDLIEGTLYRTGYPRISLQKHLPTKPAA